MAKGPAPAILAQNGAQWRADLLAILGRGDKPSEAIKGRYRHKDIKAAIIEETHGKCAYCESKVRHITHGDIEHIVPKSKVPAKAYDWPNLTLACDVCNENKGDHYSNDPALSQDNLIDPYVDDPHDHFLFMREVVAARPDSLRAKATEVIIKLNRGELMERRRERMQFLEGLVCAYVGAADAFKPMLLKDLEENHLKESDEYYTTSKTYIDVMREKGILPVA
ncbi:retron system putative HNH endonuclease [Sphingomonas alpina]|uniref:TIGR02646 family protein n=1 Tax=Sphingomonas alpina TaxID=653931 RepID=A0A7H0LM40_9SPHN|nr:retron system putative HNH endonuclease [Sphingomonas alpina]QNQ10743.1 TIGR02646 family protein [Sphingomonas alpina]